MFRFLCTRRTTLVSHADLALINSSTHLGFVQAAFFIVRLLSSSFGDKKNEQKQPFTVSYLMNSCGLSLDSAISASKYLQLKNKYKADSVLRLLTDHGLSNTQIHKVVRTYPTVILLDPGRIILPKIEFFRSIGFSRNDLAKMISKNPSLLGRSLKNHIIPNYNFLKDVVVDDKKIVIAFKRIYWEFGLDLRTIMAPNIAGLKEIGVPQSSISFFVSRYAVIACIGHSKFFKVVNEVKEMGFNPAQVTFVLALGVINGLTKSVWESKIEAYGRWGWSKEETLAAFRRHPYCMLNSEEKITRVMDFFVNKMGWLSQDIARVPVVLQLSLEKRIIPRCSVVQVLLSKGLIKEDICPSTFLVPSEEIFMERYVTKYKKKVPLLLNVYQGKIDLLDVKS